MKDEVKDLLKNPNLKLGSDEEFDYDRIPFEIDVLDDLLGGGIPKKRITLLTGPTNVGKSYLASQAVANAQRAGGTAAWIDAELSWDPTWMEKCGIDLENVLVSQPITGEEAFNTIRELMDAEVDVIVLDSIAGLVPTQVQEEEFGYNPIAWQARFINSSFPKIMPHLKKGSALIAINQMRSSMGPVSLDAMPGGLAQTYFSHFILQVRRSGWIKEKDLNVGFDMEIRCRKSKVGGKPFDSCKVPFKLDGGIDMTEVMMRECLDKGLVIQSGPWYKIEGEDSRVRGMNGLRTFFMENQDKFESFKEKLKISEE